MGAASHLGINLREYDTAIRTFIPHYGELLDEGASAVARLARRGPTVVDLGTGSGALAGRVLAARPDARVIGIDEDAAMLAMAERRLRGRITTLHANFERAVLPRCDVITASIALHHIRSARRKAAMYARAFVALRAGGLLVSADCFLASSPALRAANRASWIAHLQANYTRRKAEGFLRAWAKEDLYFPLARDIEMLEAAGFGVDVVWRKEGFAVIAAIK